jgi:hypothetical protein
MLWLWRQAPKRTNSASRLPPVLARRATRDASTANIHGHALVSSRHSRERLNDTPRRPMNRPKAGRRFAGFAVKCCLVDGEAMVCDAGGRPHRNKHREAANVAAAI